MLKKALIIILILIAGYIGWEIIYFTMVPKSKHYCPDWSQILPIHISLSDPQFPGHTFSLINDVSCLNATRVYDIIKVHSVDDIRKALQQAKDLGLSISIAGERHSMGGQAFFNDAIVLDMLEFNKIVSLDENKKLLTVQSGATWHEIQNVLNKKNLAVKSMQSSDIFTVGGSLSVNTHGMDHRIGSIASTVRSFTIMLADGTIQKITRENNAELFNLVIGGYGLFGIILEVELEVTDNVMYHQTTKRMNIDAFPAYFNEIAQNKNLELFYAHLSTSPITFFKNVITYEYTKIDDYQGTFPELRKVSAVTTRRLLLNLSKKRWYAKVIKWIAEIYIDPLISQALFKPSVSRNEVMHDSVEYLQNIVANKTDILQEYYVPRNALSTCIEKMNVLLKNAQVTTLNASIRVVHKESIFLNYAPQDMFAIVLYINLPVNSASLKHLKQLTQHIINMVLDLNGTFFLPYQLYYTKKQLEKAYPNINEFFALKRKYDPHLVFMNEFYAKYATRI